MEVKKKEELVHIPNKDLLIILTASSCYSIITDNITNRYLAHSICKNIDEIEYKALDFDNVNAYLITENYTTIPTALFDENNVKEYLNFTTTISEHSFIKFDLIPSEKLAIVWEVKEDIKIKLTNLFSGITFQNLLSSFLKQNNSHSNSINTLFLNDKLVVSVYKNKTLQLINCFDVKSVEDALYYHLLLLQSTELLENEVSLNTGGIFDKMDEFKQKLNQYFSKINSTEKGILDLLTIIA